MALDLEELDFQETELGELVLRRRRSPSFDQQWVYEVTLDGEFLMSSAVHDTETALATLALAALPTTSDNTTSRGLRVLIGGLGLGYTAAAALEHPRVNSVEVVEFLPSVIQWHRKGLVPLGEALTSDPRVRITQADFFEHIRGPRTEPYDAILLDIDHSPEELLSTRNRSFYDGSGPRDLAGQLQDPGVFALWSADPVETGFLDRLGEVFPTVRCHDLAFDVPHLETTDHNTIVVASRNSADA